MTDLAARQMVEAHVPSWVKIGVFKREQEDGKPLAVLYLPWDPAPRSANRTRGRHWSHRHQESTDAEMPALWAYREAGNPCFDFPVDVETLVFRQRAMDDDNALSGLKPLRDQLCRLGLLPDDSGEWWRNAGVWMFAHVSYRQAWSVLVIRAREDA